MQQREHIISISSRFCGPPNSGNGGYVSGLLAKAMGVPCQITLHAPPPLDTPLQLLANDEGAELRLGEQLLGSAKPHVFELNLPSAVDAATAAQAQERFEGFEQHNLPCCFVCGTNRDPLDGLRIFAGPTELRDEQVAALWTPDDTLTDESGMVSSEYLWAALDCPGYFAVRGQAGIALLGRFSAHIEQPVRAGEPLVVAGWALGHDGRKHFAGTALYNQQGEAVAWAEATWISLQKAAAA
ncbi:hypothetical protein SAMN05216271_1296 [Halopseudomonas sabulinigri]|uniref:Uncharacterized protein n=1 Tax=Halopseudomonas sabulinigri TaxID=472181 RepID=A0A1H1PY02_9GAMM|nr:hotdog fold domain-containing protein [Halopseudomonas sabulinigri]SDS16092.1 hypothetical protein SAMN05216271_1296 [Halopseudomonas sabulinigri]